jgi:uncharacterized membrane protein
MKSDNPHQSGAPRHALHEVFGAAIGAIGGATVGGLIGGPLGVVVGLLTGAGLGACASRAADANAAQLEAEDRWLETERRRFAVRSHLRNPSKTNQASR